MWHGGAARGRVGRFAYQKRLLQALRVNIHFYIFFQRRLFQKVKFFSSKRRPSNVCLCNFLPESINLKKRIKIWIFQHPKEVKRPLRTTRILEKCMKPENLEIIKARRFSVERYAYKAHLSHYKFDCYLKLF